MQLAGVFILFCLRRVSVDSSNLTTLLQADNRLHNKIADEGKLKVIEHKPAADDTPSTDVATGVSETSNVHNKWETGNHSRYYSADISLCSLT